MTTIKSIIDNQKAFFNSHNTKDINFRRERLDKLERTIKRYESEIIEALYKDLGKSES